tara:strand:- start:13788 stop:16433 length:2646 start_codon:yes stop_codon:yes gene_type:complete
MTARIGNHTYKVLPTISPVALIKDSTGLYSLFKADVAKAAKVALSINATRVSLEDLRGRYDIPKSLDEVVAVCREYSEYVLPGKALKDCLMALDTETNTLAPWGKGAKIIMVSAAVDAQKACAITLDHKDAAYDWRDALPHVLRLTMSPHPKAWWNYKFDLMMFRRALVPKIRDLCASSNYRARLETVCGHSLETVLENSCVLNTRWDGLMGEHMLDEDKKGFYGLKEVVNEYAPEYAGYEDALQEAFIEAGKTKLSSQITGFIDPLCENMPLGMDVPPKPFTTTPGTTVTGAYVQAEQTVASYKGMLKTLNKNRKEKAAEISRIKNELGLVLAWMREERPAAKTYKKMLKAYEKLVTADIKNRGNLEGNVTYEDLDLDLLSVYAAIDADTTRKICRVQRKKAFKEDPPKGLAGRKSLISLMDRHYLPVTELLADMQVQGTHVDHAYLDSLTESLTEESALKEIEIFARINADLGLPEDRVILGNPKCLVDIFIGGYGLPKLKETAKGQPSMGAEELRTYASQGNTTAKLVLEWRQLTKAKSTYVDRLKKLANADGKVHGAIHLNGTSTGRTSSSEPNLQNTPYKLGRVNIKKIFIPTPLHDPTWWESQENQKSAKEHGWSSDDKLVWVDMDFSGAEVRVLTRYAPDNDLITALKEGLDVHSWMTAEIHGHSYRDIEVGRAYNPAMEELRRETKRVVFGTLYGITAHGLRSRMGFEETRAQEIIDKLMHRFPGIRNYINKTQGKISTKKHVITPYGRFRRFPMVRMGKWMESRNHRQGVNYLIQSYCSDIVMACMVNIGKNLHRVSGRLLFTVHDSVCWEMPESKVARLPEFLSDHIAEYVLKAFPDIPVPMPYDVQVGKSYGEKVSLTKWLSENKKSFVS